MLAAAPKVCSSVPDRPALEQDQQRQRPGGARSRGARLPQFDTSERPLAHPTGPMRRRPGADASAARPTGAAGRVQHRRRSRHQGQHRDRSDRDDEEDRCDDLGSGHSGPRRAFSGQAKHLWLPRPQPRAGEHAPHRSRRAGEGAARSDIMTPREAATCGPLRDARPQSGRRPPGLRRPWAAPRDQRSGPRTNRKLPSLSVQYHTILVLTVC